MIPKWTETRHRMLVEAQNGHVCWFDLRWTWGHSSEPMTAGERVCAGKMYSGDDPFIELEELKSFASRSPWKSFKLTQQGKALLTRYDFEHPEFARTVRDG